MAFRIIGMGLLVCSLIGVSGTIAWAQDFPLGEDSLRQEGVPIGKIEGPFEMTSRIFPGTTREYWLYVPAQYEALGADETACLLVVQDGLNRANGWKLPIVMDNLIHQGEMPVTIGVFVNPGVVPAVGEDAQPRFNRSFEYDSTTNRYARFLMEELLPLVESSYRISHDPNDRSIAGASSGGICAFAVAWHRPDSFRRVLSTIGTYVGLRGGDEFATLVRKTEPKPLRIFLQDGSSDLNLYAGDWWIANQQMLSALRFSGYDVNHAWSEGGHDSKHSAMIMPDALRWLWQDYPEPVGNVAGIERRMDLMIEGESWELVSDSFEIVSALAVGLEGEVFIADAIAESLFALADDDTVETLVDGFGTTNCMMVGPGGYLYICREGAIVRVDGAGATEALIEDVSAEVLLPLQAGGLFARPDGVIVHVNEDGDLEEVATGAQAGGLMVSADQAQLFVSDPLGRNITAYQLQQDGALRFGQPYGYLHVPQDSLQSAASQMASDSQGRLYVATNLGIQVLDQLGRVHLILPRPLHLSDRVTVTDVGFDSVVIGGAERDMLYAAYQGELYRRRLNIRGVESYAAPVKPPRPRL